MGDGNLFCGQIFNNLVCNYVVYLHKLLYEKTIRVFYNNGGG